MGWRVHALFLALRTLSFFSTHLTWIFSILSGCAYFQLWKSYDVFWLWVYVAGTCIWPKLRYENLILQCTFLWRKTCLGTGERWRYALKEQSRRIDEEEENTAKFSNAMYFAITLLRLRVSAAVLIGNIHLHWTVRYYKDGAQPKLWWAPHEYLLEWGAFQYSIWLDLCLFWSTWLLAWCMQCRLCCQLGCCRYFLLCAGVVAAGAVLMEVPMYFAFIRLDRTWCNITAVNGFRGASTNYSSRITDNNAHIWSSTIPPKTVV